VGAEVEICDGEGGNFAAQVATLEPRGATLRILGKLDSWGESPLPLVLGIGLAKGEALDEADEPVTVGARVREVLRDSDAAKAGFRAGDLITDLEGQPVWSPQRFVGILTTYPGNTDLNATVQRAGAPVPLRFRLAPLPIGKLFFTLGEIRPRDQFLRVDAVEADSPAARAGLRPNDEILMVYGLSFSDKPTMVQFLIMQNVMTQIQPGNPVIIRVRRTENGQPSEEVIRYNAG